MPPQFRKNSRSRMFKLNILAKMCKDNLHFFLYVDTLSELNKDSPIECLAQATPPHYTTSFIENKISKFIPGHKMSRNLNVHHL